MPREESFLLCVNLIKGYQKLRPGTHESQKHPQDGSAKFRVIGSHNGPEGEPENKNLQRKPGRLKSKVKGAGARGTGKGSSEQIVSGEKKATLAGEGKKCSGLAKTANIFALGKGNEEKSLGTQRKAKSCGANQLKKWFGKQLNGALGRKGQLAAIRQ